MATAKYTPDSPVRIDLMIWTVDGEYWCRADASQNNSIIGSRLYPRCPDLSAGIEWAKGVLSDFQLAFPEKKAQS